MPINSLYRLLSMVGSPALEAASTFLMIPDLFNFWLSGHKACEFTDATTTQLYDQRAGDWARSLMAALDLPDHIFLPVTQSGSVLGPILPSTASSSTSKQCWAGGSKSSTGSAADLKIGYCASSRRMRRVGRSWPARWKPLPSAMRSCRRWRLGSWRP
jgi:hypothetical protein